MICAPLGYDEFPHNECTKIYQGSKQPISALKKENKLSNDKIRINASDHIIVKNTVVKKTIILIKQYSGVPINTMRGKKLIQLMTDTRVELNMYHHHNFASDKIHNY